MKTGNTAIRSTYKCTVALEKSFIAFTIFRFDRLVCFVLLPMSLDRWNTKSVSLTFCFFFLNQHSTSHHLCCFSFSIRKSTNTNQCVSERACCFTFFFLKYMVYLKKKKNESIKKILFDQKRLSAATKLRNHTYQFIRFLFKIRYKNNFPFSHKNEQITNKSFENK